jgi:hypothetical protein
MIEFRKPNRRLEDVLTRYQALEDLREVWQLGLEATNRVLPQYRSKADEIIIRNLTGALELLDNQIDQMAEFDTGKYTLERIIDDLPTAEKIPVLEREIREERQKSDASDEPGTPALG